jgi:hypothetical protein
MDLHRGSIVENEILIHGDTIDTDEKNEKAVDEDFDEKD